MKRAAGVLLSSLLAVGCLPSVDYYGPDIDDDAPTPGESFGESCYRCHGNSLSPAPPRGLGGAMENTDMGVGAHDSHLAVTAQSTWHAPIPCASCHLVPAEDNAPGHMDDGDNRAEVSFGDLAKTGGLTPSRNSDGTCSNVYCHGASLSGGTNNQPLWNQVDGAQRQCGSCHGVPPPAPHPEGSSCGSCHPSMEPGDAMVFLDPSLHINGIVEVNGGGGGGACDSCHGSGGLAAPPRDLAGNTDRNSPGVGAHREHFGTSAWRREITCSNCHVVPTSVGAAGHMDGDNVPEVPFDVLNPSGTVDFGTDTCSNLYCHGNGRGNNGTASWTSQTAMTCNSCHITPAVGQNAQNMSGAHDKHIRDKKIACVECHADVVNAATNVIGPQLHLDGQRNVRMPKGGTWTPATKRCSNMACHGSESWNGD